MQDQEMVAAVVAGDPDGISQAYDTYAMPLYSYCRSLLREPADAADAVQDTFLIATAKLGGLRDPAKLRSWLFAVARNECYRRLRSGQAASALDEAVDMPAAGGYGSTAESVDVAGAVERAELRQLVRDAIGVAGVVGAVIAAGVAALPVALGIGILKYRLYEIDRIISRTLAYAIVTGLLVGVYAGLVLLATRVLPLTSRLSRR